MTENTTKTALVTGANSGLGFEAAAQLAEQGFGRVILACRTLEKAAQARLELVERTGLDPYEELAVDVSDNAVVEAAVATLAQRGHSIDYLLLNAGLVAGKNVLRNAAGVELTAAASLVGHHVLTTGLLARGLLDARARIVIAGSEAARDDVPMMAVTDVAAHAQAHYDGDRTEAILNIVRAAEPYAYANMPHYATVKTFVAWWAAALARRLPEGMVVVSVSPGSAPDTGAMRNQSRIFQFVMGIMMRLFGSLLGLGAPVATAARRYLDAIDYGPDASGKFFASRAGKMIGPVVEQRQDHILDLDSQEALWRAAVQLGGAGADAPLREVA